MFNYRKKQIVCREWETRSSLHLWSRLFDQSSTGIENQSISNSLGRKYFAIDIRSDEIHCKLQNYIYLLIYTHGGMYYLSENITGHTKVCNQPQPATIIYNHPQPSATSHNQPQPSTTTHNHPQSPTTTHNHPHSSTTTKRIAKRIKKE